MQEGNVTKKERKGWECDGNEAERGGEIILHQLSIPSSMGYAHQCADLGTEVALGT